MNGEVRLELYKGQVRILGRHSESDSLYDEAVVTFEDDAGAYDQKDAAGFIRLNSLRLRTRAARYGAKQCDLLRGALGRFAGVLRRRKAALKFAQIKQHAGPAAGLACGADVTSVQDQQVMSILKVGFRDVPEYVLHGPHGLLGAVMWLCQAKMCINCEGRFSEGRVEHHVGGFPTHPGERF